MWPFNTFITVALPIGGGLWWLAFNRRRIYKKLFSPLIVLVGIFFILSAVWDLSSSTTMSAVVPYFELGKFNDARRAADNVRIFSGLFVLNSIVTCGYLYLLRQSAESGNKKPLNLLRKFAEIGNIKLLGLLRRFAESDNKEPLYKEPLNKEPLKKRSKNKRGGNNRKR